MFQSSWKILPFFAAAALMRAPIAARADTLVTSSGPIPGITITDARDGKIQFKNAGGRESSREFSQVLRIGLDDEPAFTAAEQAFDAKRMEEATDGYLKTLDSTAKDWLKQWTATRLLLASQSIGRFDAAAKAYVALLLRDPAGAAKLKPAMPNEKSAFLTTAIADVNNTLADLKLSPQQKQALLGYLADLQRARKDPAANQTMEQALKAAPADTVGAGAAAGAVAKAKLDSAAAALAQKDFAKAQAEINASRALFTQPADQARALYYLAEAQSGVAAANPGTLPEVWTDAAVAYMRVVAHFKETQGAPFVAASLAKAAAIEEKLNDPAAASALYKQLATDYPNDPAASSARDALARLAKSK